MKPWIKADQVRKRIPEGRKLPSRFDDFVKAEPPYAVEWNSLDAYCLKRSATKEAVPFLRLPDGGLVALWYHTESPAVVHIGAHGERGVLTRSFDDFLRALNAGKSGLPDFDDDPNPFRVKGVNGEPKSQGLPALQKEFEEWFKRHTSLLEPLQTPDAESLRQRVFRIAEAMIRDGRCKVYNLSSSWWSMDYRIDRDESDVEITYLDYGKWYAVPKKYKLHDEVPTLLGLVKHKKRNHYELSVCSPGLVSIDSDRELLLMPP